MLEASANWFIVSIHAPARGATQTPKEWFNLARKFQFTLPRGERHP